MPVGIPLLTIELIKAAPRVVEAGVKLYDTVSKRQPTRSPDGAPKSGGVAELQERVDSLESGNQAQVELITQIAKHQAGLVRWVMALTVVALLASGAAIAALVIVVVG